MDPLSVEGRLLLPKLKEAVQAIRRVSDNTPPPTPPNDTDLTRAILSDISHGAILFDRDGYTAGARDLLMGRSREYLLEFSDAMRGFNDAFQPFQSVTDDFEGIPAKISDLKAECARQIALERKNWITNE